MRLVDAIAPGGDTIAALFVNFVLALVAMLLIGRLALRLTDDAEVAARAMVIFAVFPGSFVLSFAYAEAALIALCAACLLLLLDERWVLAGLVGALATATRPNGVAIVAACAVASFIAIRQRRDWMSLAAPLLSPIGFIVFQAFLRHHTDESWPWFRVQREAWREGTSFGATAVRNTISFLGSPLASPTDVLTVATMIAMFGVLWCAWRHPLPLPLLAYVVVVIALMLLPATVTARPRFLFTAFPLVIPVATWWSHRDRIGWELTLVACGAGLATLTGSVRGLRGDPVRLGWARRPPLGVVVLGLLAYVPALSAGRGRMPADTKLYLYLDPGRLVSDAPYTFDGRQFAGWVPHQTISYLWPSGPWYWLFDVIGVPDWIAHRLWIGTILFVAGLGVRWLARLLGIVGTAAVAAAAVYQLSPYVLPYLSRTSLMLLPVRRPRLDHRPHGARRSTRVVAARRAARAGRGHRRGTECDGDRDDRAGAAAVVGARGMGWRDHVAPRCRHCRPHRWLVPRGVVVVAGDAVRAGPLRR